MYQVLVDRVKETVCRVVMDTGEMTATKVSCISLCELLSFRSTILIVKLSEQPEFKIFRHEFLWFEIIKFLLHMHQKVYIQRGFCKVQYNLLMLLSCNSFCISLNHCCSFMYNSYLFAQMLPCTIQTKLRN